MTNDTIVIAAGGTGGHVFPALAVANKLLEKDFSVVWVGSEAGLENNVVPENGIELRNIAVSPLRGGGLVRKVTGLFNLVRAISSSLKIVRSENPRAVLGMGGYVAGPVCLAARLGGFRMVLHEQNAVAGFTNRHLQRFANRVLEAMPNTFAKDAKVLCTGNPLRRQMLQVQEPESRYSERHGPIRVLVIGGSQGARALNKLVPDAISKLDTEFEVTHQCGVRWMEETRGAYAVLDSSPSARVDIVEFIDDMANAYSTADVIICRSGAMTVAEIAAVGVAAILIPFPSAVDDHQTANGQYLVDAGAALMFSESELTAQALAEQLNSLDRDTLKIMAVAAHSVAKRDATDRVVAELTGVAA